MGGNIGEIYSVAFSPDSRTIVSGSSDGSLRRWDARNGRPIGLPSLGHKGFVCSVAVSSDGSTLVSGSSDHNLRLWDSKSGQPLGPPLRGHTGSVNSVAFSPDGSSIISGCSDNTMRFWPAPPDWPDKLCFRLTRNMSRKEWSDWVSSSSEIPYTCQCPDLPITPNNPNTDSAREECDANNEIFALTRR